MSEAKFTPGPWEIGQYEWLIQEEEKDGVDGEIAQANSHRPDFAANARLIAAAPDLLHLLEQAVDEQSDSPWLRAARQAIAKAKGGA